jgi:hypothetical protein
MVFLWLFKSHTNVKDLILAIVPISTFFDESRPIRRRISNVKMLIKGLQILDLKTKADYTSRLLSGYKVFDEMYC